MRTRMFQMVMTTVLSLVFVAAGACSSDSNDGSGFGPVDPSAANNSATAAAQGYYSAVGSAIVDDTGSVVTLRGVKWGPTLTENQTVAGLDQRRLSNLVREIKDGLGINIIEIPFSSRLFDPDLNQDPQNVNDDLNPELEGLTGLEVLDKLVEAIGAAGMKVILTHKQGGPLWYNDDYPESTWIANWEALATRYTEGKVVVGMNLTHRPGDPAHTGEGDDPDNDWRRAATAAGNAIQAKNSNLLIIVQGVQTHGEGESYFPGSNLEGFRGAPLALDFPNKIVMSATLGCPTPIADDEQVSWWQPENGAPEALLLTAEGADQLAALWNQNWAYLATEGIAPLYLSEMGCQDTLRRQRAVFSPLLKFVADNQVSFSWRALEPGDANLTVPIMEGNFEVMNDDFIDKHLRQLFAPQI